MAADPLVGARVYEEIRRRLFAGDYRLHARLDVGALADALGASSTPVREALVRLAAERLITQRPTRGFFVSIWSEAELGALYAWRGALVGWALAGRAGAGDVMAGEAAAIDTGAGYPARVAALLQALEAGANPELARAGANADDRLFAARRAEVEIFTDIEREVSDLAAHVRAGARSSLRAGLRRYHARRVRAVARVRDRAVLHALAGV